MKRKVICAALAIAASVLTQGALAVQSVYPASDASGGNFTPVGALPTTTWSTSRAGGQSLVFYGRYTSDNAAESGLGLQLQFDSTKIKNVAIDQVLTKCIVSFPPDLTVAGSVILAWADSSVRNPPAVGWPGLVDGAAALPGVVGQANPGCITLPGPPVGYVQTTAAFAPPTNLFRFTATTDAAFTSGSTSITFASTGGGNFTPTTLQVNGVVQPPCNRDVDNIGAVTAGVDGILIRRSLNSFILAANIPNGITFPGSALRTVGSDIRAYVVGLGNVLDVDGGGASTPVAGVDGILIQRALNTFIASSAITNGVTTPATGSQVRTYLNNNCGTSLTP